MTRWEFSASTSVVVLACALWLVALGLAFLQVRRRGATRGVIALETLRMLAVSLLCVALLQPEFVREIARTEEPEIVVLRDASGSMATRDVAGENLTAKVVTRGEWIAAREAENFAEGLETNARLLYETFGVDGDGTDLGAALERVVQRGGNVRAVLLLSDGDWNAGESPVGAATKLRAQDVPVFTIGIGSEKHLPDLALEQAETPAYGLLGEQISIPFKIASHLPREVRTYVALNGPAGQEATRAVTVPAFGEVADTIVWQPGATGDFTLELKLPVEADELLDDNNAQTFRIGVRTETLKVLVVDSLPRWEYRFLRNALERDPGVEVSTLLLHPALGAGEGRGYLPVFPAGKEEISGYDVIFLGDVGMGEGELTAADLELVRGVVEQQGSGLVFLPGRRGRELSLVSSPVGDLLPVELDASNPQGTGSPHEAHLVLTGIGRGHLLTMLAADESKNAAIWQGLPGFYWSAPVVKSRPGAEVLAVHGTLRNEWGRLPLLVTRAAGNGKVLFMGTDGAWRWRRGVEDRYHYRFWGQVVRWMAHARHLARGESVRLSFSPEQPAVGETVFLLATVLDPGGFPVEKGEVSVLARAPSGRTERVELVPVAGGWGVFKGALTLREGGKYQLEVENKGGGQRLETEIFVAAPTREKVGQPANLSVLRELAQITGGAAGGTEDLARIVERIALLPEASPLEERVRVWSAWWFGALVLVVCGAYWAGRKAMGMI